MTKPHISVLDAPEVYHGSPSEPGQATFTVELSRRSARDLTFDVALNPASNAGGPLQYITAQNVGDIESCPSQVTIPAGAKTASFDIQLAGDTQIEPQEQFSLMLTPTAGERVVMDKSTAIGTVAGDGNFFDVNADFSTSGITDNNLIALLTTDLDAAAARIEAALGDTVPRFDVIVRTAHFAQPNALAKCAAVFDTSAEIDLGDHQVLLPIALWEHLTSSPSNPAGDDPGGRATTVLILSADKLDTWFSGYARADVVTMLTHELLHGLDFGLGLTTARQGNPQAQSIWEHFEVQSGDTTYFEGQSAIDAHVPMRGANAGVRDFMDSVIGSHTAYGLFGEPISSLDVAILHDLGYTTTVPGWAQPIPAAALGSNALADFMIVGELTSTVASTPLMGSD